MRAGHGCPLPSRGGVGKWLAGCLLVPAALLHASETDIRLEQPEILSAEGRLDAASERKAEAMALFARGIFEEESFGTEHALETYRESLRQDPTNLHLALRLAQEYLRRGQSAEAIGILKNASKENPKSFLPPLMMANIYLKQLRKPDLAETQARRALTLGADFFAPVEILWEIYQYQGQPSKAESVLAKAAESSSTHAWYWLRLAELHRRMQPLDRPASAQAQERMEAALRQSASLGWEEPDVLSKVAEFRVLAGSYNEAKTLYEQLYALDPAYPSALEKLAAVCVETRDFEQARPLLIRMLELNPQNLWACDQLAATALEVREYEQALEYRQRGLLLAPLQPERHLEVIDLLLRLQRFETAVIYAEQARARFPGAGLFTFLHGVALSRAEKPAEALAIFERSLIEAATGPSDYVSAEFYFEYGVAAEQAKEFSKAAELFRKSIEMDPSNAARACNYLGYMWAERGEHLEEAEALIRRALESEPENGAYVDSLGWVFYKQGKYAEALVELLRAAELIEEPDPVIFDHIADAYQKLGRHPEALLYWQKALQLDSENLAIREKIDNSTSQVVRKELVPEN